MCSSGWLLAIGAVMPTVYHDPAWAQCAGYSVDILAGPDCKFESSSAYASGVNQAGELCGAYYTCDDSGYAALWLGEGAWIPLLNIPPGFTGFNPLDINPSRQLAGTTSLIQNPKSPRAAIYDFTTGSLTNLGALPGHNWSEALAISTNGTVIGNSNNTAFGPLTGFFWQSGTMSALPLPYGTSSEALDISGNDKICGWMGNHAINDTHAFVYDLPSGLVTDAGTPLPTTNNARATGVNNAGAICGWSYISCGKSCLNRRSFFWDDGEVQDLGVLPGNLGTHALAINDSNVIVGYCITGGSEAFVWRNGVIMSLADLIPSEAGLSIEFAFDINNLGQIVGVAEVVETGDDVAVRLTPIPSPTGDSDCDSDVV